MRRIAMAMMATALMTTSVALTGGCPDDGPTAGDVSADSDSSDAAACAPYDAGPETSPPEPAGPRLIDNAQWTLLADPEDPWAPERPVDKTPCVPADLVVEDIDGEPWMSVRTAACGYATLMQPLLEDVPACSLLLVHVWYFKFLAPKETDGVGYDVVVTVGDDTEPLLRFNGDQLPSESGLLYHLVRTERAYTAGEPVYFHVSNHGSNSWEFIQMRNLDAAAAPTP